MGVFDIIGPVMVGPSSSHTAGAARIGLVASLLLGKMPKKAVITLHGSFAQTAKGHGTDKAIIGGLLGFRESDLELRRSFEIAKERGLSYEFLEENLGDVHPNTAKIELFPESGEELLEILASSTGGGKILIQEIGGEKVSFKCEYPTVVVFSLDRPGTLTNVTGAFTKEDINIAFMKLFRQGEGKNAIMVIETDSSVSQELLSRIEGLEHIKKAVYVPPLLG